MHYLTKKGESSAEKGAKNAHFSEKYSRNSTLNFTGDFVRTTQPILVIFGGTKPQSLVSTHAKFHLSRITRTKVIQNKNVLDKKKHPVQRIGFGADTEARVFAAATPPLTGRKTIQPV